MSELTDKIDRELEELRTARRLIADPEQRQRRKRRRWEIVGKFLSINSRGLPGSVLANVHASVGDDEGSLFERGFLESDGWVEIVGAPEAHWRSPS